MPWRLYFISLLPLFVFIELKYFEPDSFLWLWNRCWCCLRCEDYAFTFAAMCTIVAIVMLSHLSFYSRNNFQISGAKTINNPELLNHELMGVLSSVVLPFLTVNFTTFRECTSSILIIILIGLISTKSNLYYKNPVLAIFNLKIYRVETQHKNDGHPEDFDVISFNKLNKGDSLYLKKIGNGVYFAKKT